MPSHLKSNNATTVAATPSKGRHSQQGEGAYLLVGDPVAVHGRGAGDRIQVVRAVGQRRHPRRAPLGLGLPGARLPREHPGETRRPTQRATKPVLPQHRQKQRPQTIRPTRQRLVSVPFRCVPPGRISDPTVKIL